MKETQDFSTKNYKTYCINSLEDFNYYLNKDICISFLGKKAQYEKKINSLHKGKMGKRLERHITAKDTENGS